MRVRVGIDLLEVQEVEDSVRTHADRYLERVFTPGELADCRTDSGVDAERLAARFAAKEATIKVLRPGDVAVPWTSIEVERAPSGSVVLRLDGEAASLAAAAGVGDLALSFSHERGLAAAVVVAAMHLSR
jgi:holo-[acyl-carrier protein] synthase